MLSCEICEIFINTYFEEHLRTAASIMLTDPQHAVGLLYSDTRQAILTSERQGGAFFYLPIAFQYFLCP